MNTESSRENRKLSRLTFITGVGDFLTFFAVVQFIVNLTDKVSLAAYSVAIQSLGILVGSITFPWISSRVSTKQTIAWCQILSAICVGGILFIISEFEDRQKAALGSVYILLGMQACLKQIFNASRETHSKMIGTNADSRTLQADLVHSLYSAQVVGPILSFILIRYFPIKLSLYLDLLTFAAAGYLALQLSFQILPQAGFVFRPISFLKNRQSLSRLFWVRSLWFWIPTSVYNFLLFGIVAETFKLKLAHAAWIYALIGLGSMTSSSLLRKGPFSEKLSRLKLKDSNLAGFALVLMALARFAFPSSSNIYLAAIAIFIGGIGTGINAVSTQALRRRLTNNREFIEIVGLEFLVSRITDVAIQTACLYLITNGVINWMSGMMISSILTFGVAFLTIRIESDTSSRTSPTS